MRASMIVFASIVVVSCLAGCSTSQPVSKFGRYQYEYPSQVLAMPSCNATVETRSFCGAMLKSHNGTTIIIGGPSMGIPRGFIESLTAGETYRLPQAFMDYQEKQQKKEPNKTIDSDTK